MLKFRLHRVHPLAKASPAKLESGEYRELVARLLLLSNEKRVEDASFCCLF